MVLKWLHFDGEYFCEFSYTQTSLKHQCQSYLLQKTQTTVAHIKQDTPAFQRNYREVKVLPCCFHVASSSQHWYMSRSTISSAWNRNLGYNRVWAAGFWGNEKAEEQLASVIGLLASSHRAWLTCLWSIPGTFAQRTKTQQIMMIRNFWISNSYWQTRCSNVSDIRLWCELIDTVCPFKVRLSSKSQTGLKRKW